jgi:Zn-finger nucleic acid-binding protein
VKCPVCRVPGFVVEHQAIELDICAECHGIWFDAGELELVLGDAEALEGSPVRTAEAKRPCPICDRKMDKVNIGPDQGVLIDSCPAGCGLWFDAGELAQLTRNLTEEGWTVAPEVREFLHDLFSDQNTDPDGE